MSSNWKFQLLIICSFTQKSFRDMFCLIPEISCCQVGPNCRISPILLKMQKVVTSKRCSYETIILKLKICAVNCLKFYQKKFQRHILPHSGDLLLPSWAKLQNFHNFEKMQKVGVLYKIFGWCKQVQVHFWSFQLYEFLPKIFWRWYFLSFWRYLGSNVTEIANFVPNLQQLQKVSIF